jgi:hypothetical protein
MAKEAVRRLYGCAALSNRFASRSNLWLLVPALGQACRRRKFIAQTIHFKLVIGSTILMALGAYLLWDDFMKPLFGTKRG